MLIVHRPPLGINLPRSLGTANPRKQVSHSGMRLASTKGSSSGSAAIHLGDSGPAGGRGKGRETSTEWAGRLFNQNAEGMLQKAS